MTEEEFKNLKPGTRVVDKDGGNGVTMEFEEWFRRKKVTQPDIQKEEFEYNGDQVYVEYDKYVYSNCKYEWSRPTYYTILDGSSNISSSCNHKYILMLNNRCCEHCGEYE